MAGLVFRWREKVPPRLRGPPSFSLRGQLLGHASAQVPMAGQGTPFLFQTEQVSHLERVFCCFGLSGLYAIARKARPIIATLALTWTKREESGWDGHGSERPIHMYVPFW